MTSLCSVPGCPSPRYARGYCVKHYARVKTHGDPHVVMVARAMLGKFGTDHPQWGGRDISYSGAHTRVQRSRGRANGSVCACGAPAAEWAYDHADPDELLSPKGRPYSPDPQHYVAMCVSCHRVFDGVPR